MANPAINAALIAAAAKQHATAKAIEKELTDAAATSAGRAAPFTPASDTERSLLDYAIKRGTIREAGGGRYWLDTDRQKELQARARNIALIITAGLLSLLASLAAIASAQ